VSKPAQSLGFNVISYVLVYCMWNPKFLGEFCVVLKKKVCRRSGYVYAQYPYIN